MTRSRQEGAISSGAAGTDVLSQDAPVTFVLIDDQEDIRSLTTLLAAREPGVKLLGTAGDAAEGLALVERLRPDVVLLDVMMPGVSGFDLLPELVRRCPGTKVLMYSAGDDLSAEAIALGAHGWIVKSSDWRGVLARIISVGRAS